MSVIIDGNSLLLYGHFLKFLGVAHHSHYHISTRTRYFVSYFVTYIFHVCRMFDRDDGNCCCTIWRIVVWLDNWKKSIFYILISLPLFSKASLGLIAGNVSHKTLLNESGVLSSLECNKQFP